MEYAMNYATVNTGSGTSGDRFAVDLWGDTSKSWALLLIGMNTSGETCVAVAETDANGWASAYVDDVSDYGLLMLGFVNLGNGTRDPDNNVYSTNSFSYDLEYSSNASDVTSRGRVVCGTPATGGDDDDDPIGCLCALQAEKEPLRGFGAVGAVLLSLFAGVAISWRRRSFLS